MTDTAKPDWIAADWGTSRLRVWAMAGDAPVAERASEAGMGRLAGAGFEAALLRLVEPWLTDAPIPVIAAGMVGARRGWVEAPYLPAPLTLEGLSGAMTRAPTADPRLSFHIAPGVSQSAPPDVMRGEETQLLGLARLDPGYTGTVCLPGTHSKWARLEGGRLTRFHTAMTGELFELIATRSVIAAALEGGEEEGGFERGLREGLDAPGALTSAIFALRAESLLRGGSGAARRARLSGMLIGAEIAAAPEGTGAVSIIGAGPLAALYARAIGAAGGTARIEDATATTLAGLTALKESLP